MEKADDFVEFVRNELKEKAEESGRTSSESPYKAEATKSLRGSSALKAFIIKYHQSWKECGCNICIQRRGANDLIYKMLLDLDDKKLVKKLKKEESERWKFEVKNER